MSDYKLYFIVNSSLKMGNGKTAGQVGHACSAIIRRAYEQGISKKEYELWVAEMEAKIVLKTSNEEEFFEICNKLKKDDFLPIIIKDAGKTQIEPNSSTVIVFGPINVKKCPSYISNLKLL